MPVIRITREELQMVFEAAARRAHRTGSSLVIRWERIEIVDKR